ncbi:MAG: enoyl-CoA hydratase [Acidimicrobiales bacterium]|nr:enoyl-CoA hydratase [Acidimicrobiales bacterium]
MTGPTDVVLTEITDGVATVTLNRPEARNALSGELRRELWRTVEELGGDEDVAAIVLTGADPAFCAGLDLKELAATSGQGLGGTDASSPVAAEGVDRPGPIPHLDKPVIGAVNGVAVTGGFELALNCHFLVASEQAAFADTHARMGIMPGWGLTVLLAEAVGLRRAREMSATGNFIDAGTALTWGLVNHVVPHEELVPFTQRLAADIVSNDRPGVTRMLQTYDEGSLVDGAGFWALEGRVSREWMAGRDGADLEARRRAVTERGRSQT